MSKNANENVPTKDRTTCPNCQARSVRLGYIQGYGSASRWRPAGKWFSTKPLHALACEACGVVTLRLAD